MIGDADSSCRHEHEHALLSSGPKEISRGREKHERV